MTPLLEISCTCWPGLHLQLYLLSKGTRSMGIYFTRTPKIKRAPTKTVVSDLMQQTRMRKWTHIMVEYIWELDYGPNFKVPLFRCKWVKMTGGGVTVDQLYGM